MESICCYCCAAMGCIKHIVMARFKEGVSVEEIVKGMEKLASMDCIKSFEWGHDTRNEEMLRQGFTHAFILGFENEEDFSAYLAHPNHLEFAGTFRASREKSMVLDFMSVSVKSPT